MIHSAKRQLQPRQSHKLVSAEFVGIERLVAWNVMDEPTDALAAYLRIVLCVQDMFVPKIIHRTRHLKLFGWRLRNEHEEAPILFEDRRGFLIAPPMSLPRPPNNRFKIPAGNLPRPVRSGPDCKAVHRRSSAPHSAGVWRCGWTGIDHCRLSCGHWRPMDSRRSTAFQLSQNFSGSTARTISAKAA